MRILTFTNLYPNNVQENHGLFVEHRLVNFLKNQAEFQAKVVAPVPWIPTCLGKIGKYGKYASIRRHDERRGIEVIYPRFPVIPKIGMTIAPLLLAGFCRQALGKVIASGWDFDLIDAHYFYPDGVAAVMLGRQLQKPVVITGRGSDINVLPNFLLPRKQIDWAARNCSGIITVCDALRGSLIGFGIEPSKIRTLRNGVDLEVFRPVDKLQARRKLGLEPDKILLLSVGHLVENKGHHLIIDALAKLKSHATLLIVGEGSLHNALVKRAEEKRMSGRVRFCGSLRQSELPVYYNAADMLVLASKSEGMANVILESFACGTPVVATDVSGTPEILIHGATGQLVQHRTANDIASGIEMLLANRPIPSEVRRHAEQFSWEATNAGQAEMFREAVSTYRGISEVSQN